MICVTSDSVRRAWAAVQHAAAKKRRSMAALIIPGYKNYKYKCARSQLRAHQFHFSVLGTAPRGTAGTFGISGYTHPFKKALFRFALLTKGALAARTTFRARSPNETHHPNNNKQPTSNQ